MSETPSSRPPGTGRDGKSAKVAAADQVRIVRRYLSAVEAGKRGRGPKRTADAIGNRITKLDELLVSADPLTRVHLTQERIELHAEYVRVGNGDHGDLAQLERDFVRVARSYGDRNGLTYAAWRQVGVDGKVLERAGIRRAEKKPPPAAARAAAEKPAAGKETIGDASAEPRPEDAPAPPSGGNQEPAPAPESSPAPPPAPRRPTPPTPPATGAPTPAPAEPAASPPPAPRRLFGTEAAVAGTGAGGAGGGDAGAASTQPAPAGERAATEAGDGERSEFGEGRPRRPGEPAPWWPHGGVSAPPHDGEANPPT